MLATDICVDGTDVCVCVISYSGVSAASTVFVAAEQRLFLFLTFCCTLLLCFLQIAIINTSLKVSYK